MALLYNIHDDFICDSFSDVWKLQEAHQKIFDLIYANTFLKLTLPRKKNDVFKWHVEHQNKQEETMSEKEPMAGDIVLYEGKYRRAMCECSDPGGSLWREVETDDNTEGGVEYFNDSGPYDCDCSECHNAFWFDPRVEYGAHGVIAYPVEQDHTLAPISHLLHDLYGRREHEQWMKEDKLRRERERHTRLMHVGEKLGAIMDKHCGEARVDEPEHEVRKLEAAPWNRDRVAEDRIQTQGYRDLVAQVEKIDPEAAWYMRTEAFDLPGFYETKGLTTAFTWKDTPQGWDYWNHIYDRML